MKERIRYYLVFATNSLHGIEVFKLAEREANRTQDQIRYETHSKHQVQSLLPFGNEAPKSMKAAELRTKYIERAKKRLIEVLWASDDAVSYADIYGEFLSLPIVEKTDLDTTLRELGPMVKLALDGAKRKAPSPFKNDLVVVDRRLLKKRFPQ